MRLFDLVSACVLNQRKPPIPSLDLDPIDEDSPELTEKGFWVQHRKANRVGLLNLLKITRNSASVMPLFLRYSICFITYLALTPFASPSKYSSNRSLNEFAPPFLSWRFLSLGGLNAFLDERFSFVLS